MNFAILLEKDFYLISHQKNINDKINLTTSCFYLCLSEFPNFNCYMESKLLELS
jgi:hypothetical protein